MSATGSSKASGQSSPFMGDLSAAEKTINDFRDAERLSAVLKDHVLMHDTCRNLLVSLLNAQVTMQNQLIQFTDAIITKNTPQDVAEACQDVADAEKRIADNRQDVADAEKRVANVQKVVTDTSVLLDAIKSDLDNAARHFRVSSLDHLQEYADSLLTLLSRHTYIAVDVKSSGSTGSHHPPTLKEFVEGKHNLDRDLTPAVVGDVRKPVVLSTTGRSPFDENFTPEYLYWQPRSATSSVANSHAFTRDGVPGNIVAVGRRFDLRMWCEAAVYECDVYAKVHPTKTGDEQHFCYYRGVADFHVFSANTNQPNSESRASTTKETTPSSQQEQNKSVETWSRDVDSTGVWCPGYGASLATPLSDDNNDGFTVSSRRVSIKTIEAARGHRWNAFLRSLKDDGISLPTGISKDLYDSFRDHATTAGRPAGGSSCTASV